MCVFPFFSCELYIATIQTPNVTMVVSIIQVNEKGHIGIVGKVQETSLGTGIYA